MSDEPRAWVIVLRPVAAEVPVAVRVRKLLKRAAELGLRCVSVRDADADEAGDKDRVIEGLAERVCQQSELLSRRAEKVE